jgi:ferredoxin
VDTRLQIDSTLCCGFGNCESVCPEVFQVDPTTSHVRLLRATVTAEQSTQVQRAADECPTRAIEILAEAKESQ